MEESKDKIESIPDANLAVVPTSAASFDLHGFVKWVNQFQSEQQTYSTASGDRLEIWVAAEETYLTDVAIMAKITASNGNRFLHGTAGLI